jgi:hypothetical protein
MVKDYEPLISLNSNISYTIYFEIGRGIIVSELTSKNVFHLEINYAVSDKKKKIYM